MKVLLQKCHVVHWADVNFDYSVSACLSEVVGGPNAGRATEVYSSQDHRPTMRIYLLRERLASQAVVQDRDFSFAAHTFPLAAFSVHSRDGALFLDKMAANGLGSCRYCGETIEDVKWAPLQCGMCKGLVHINCVHGERPSACYGDKFFDFTCRHCSADGKESCSRMSMSW